MTEFFIGFGILLGYFIVCATIALICKRFVKMPNEVFRKLLHMILICSIFVLTYAFSTWWISVAASVLFALIVFPILLFAERIPGYSNLLTERKKGEIKKSLLIVFLMFSILISVCWGLLNLKYLVIASVFAWGFGDAAAAFAMLQRAGGAGQPPVLPPGGAARGAGALHRRPAEHQQHRGRRIDR